MGKLAELANFARWSKPIPKRERRVCLGLCLHRDISPETFYSVSFTAACPDPIFAVRMQKGDALIARSRSILASKFLKDGTEDVLLFADDDILFQPEDAVKIAGHIFDGGKDIVGGAYVTKSETQPTLQQKIFKNQEILLSPRSLPVEVRYVSTGFMAIHKRVFEKMIEDKERFPLCYPQEFYPFFDTGCKEIDGKMRYLGEDWNFCENARNLGFKIWLDPSIMLAHSGRYVYTVGDIGRSGRVSGQPIKYSEVYDE